MSKRQGPAGDRRLVTEQQRALLAMALALQRRLGQPPSVRLLAAQLGRDAHRVRCSVASLRGRGLLGGEGETVEVTIRGTRCIDG